MQVQQANVINCAADAKSEHVPSMNLKIDHVWQLSELQPNVCPGQDAWRSQESDIQSAIFGKFAVPKKLRDQVA